MAQKRKAQEAFGRSSGKLSAFAAARLAREQHQTISEEPTGLGDEVDGSTALAATLANQQYDGHHDRERSSTFGPEGPVANAASPKSIKNARLSTFTLTNDKIIRDDKQILEFSLPQDQSVTLVGEYDLEVTSGAITVYGAVMNRDSGKHRVFAPSTHALPQVIARKAGTRVRIISVESSLRKLGKLSPLFRNIWAAADGGRSFAYVETSADDPLQRSLVALEDEAVSQRVLSRLAVNAETAQGRIQVMPVGPKSSGKSTFTRQLCNALLTRTSTKRCFYLDLDPGQPEFGPPGQIYLVEVRAAILGPPFTHHASRTSPKYRLVAAHTLAATTFKDDPEHYLACVKELISQHHLPSIKEAGHAPLIINSCGWVTGLGAHTLCRILDQPVTDTVLIDVTEPTLLQTVRSRSENTYSIPRPPTKPSSRTPAELRSMHTMSYFHHRTGHASKVEPWSINSKPVSQLRPWIVRYSVPESGIAAIMSYSQAPSPDFLAEVLDGAVVALVAADDKAGLEAALAPSRDIAAAAANSYGASRAGVRVQRTAEGLPYVTIAHGDALRPLDPRFCRSYGLALVRGIDVESGALHLLTPLAESEIAALMAKEVVLVRGAFDASDWAYLEELNAAGDVDADVERPWTARRAMVGIEGAVWRLRHPPTASQIGAGG